jgi:lysozyme
MARQINSAGMDLIRKYEGCELTVYADIAGLPTVGYGHRVMPDEDLEIGDTITQNEADNLLLQDLSTAENEVSQAIFQPLNDNQFSALVSLVYNTGPAPLHMTLGHYLNQGKYDLASNEFPLWDHSGGKVIPGLMNRRLAEQDLFNAPLSDA